jgi:hypothetical protein
MGGTEGVRGLGGIEIEGAREGAEGEETIVSQSPLGPPCHPSDTLIY